MAKKEEDMDFDELLTKNTALQSSGYYKRVKWVHDHESSIRKTAHTLYKERIEKGIEGNALADWYRAQSILLLLEFIQ